MPEEKYWKKYKLALSLAIGFEKYHLAWGIRGLQSSQPGYPSPACNGCLFSLEGKTLKTTEFSHLHIPNMQGPTRFHVCKPGHSISVHLPYLAFKDSLIDIRKSCCSSRVCLRSEVGSSEVDHIFLPAPFILNEYSVCQVKTSSCQTKA